MAKIDLIAPRLPFGLRRSVAVVKKVMERAGHQVAVRDLDRDPPGALQSDLVMFLESINPAWLGVAPVSCMIPNPEWVRDQMLQFLDQVDVVFAKTHHAVEAFAEIGCHVVYTGFSSRDQLMPRIRSDASQWLHVAGHSKQKGTATVLRVWEKNPTFPQLTIVQPSQWSRRRRIVLHPRTRPILSNVNLITKYLGDRKLRRLQNQSKVHICPSEAEGWGHYIVEAMSIGAVVLTTDAPPMNEIVRPDRGYLCPYGSTAPQRLATNYYVTPDALQNAVESILRSEPQELSEVGRRARAFFLDNDAQFSSRFTAALDRALGRT